MSNKVIRVGVVQAKLAGSTADNVKAITELVREAAAAGAHIVCLPELIEGPYFPQSQDEAHFALAKPVDNHPTITHFSELAAELEVVLPVSFFEKAGPHYYNSVALVDADGSLVTLYRKSHIPDGPGYQEKFYFRPGETGFTAWTTRYARVGVAICWDQWFPEAARAMVLDGADILLYPTAIGSEPQDANLDTAKRWQRAMVGHAVSNSCIVAAANRVGIEGDQTFYGSSFVCDFAGEMLTSLDRVSETTGVVDVDLDEVARERAAWGFFRDRRPDLYRQLSEHPKAEK